MCALLVGRVSWIVPCVVSLASWCVVGCTCGGDRAAPSGAHVEPGSLEAPRPAGDPAASDPVSSDPAPSGNLPEPRIGAPERTSPTDEALARMRAELREGRRLARSGDDVAALARYQAALEAAPNARARCEAGFVAHRAGQADLAKELVTQALRELPAPHQVDDDLRVPLAMCLYNAGLVLEARGEPGEAAAAFDRSLALRPNATVQAARARVGGTPPAPPPTVERTGTLPALVAEARAEWCARAELDPCPPECREGEPDEDTCATDPLDAAGGPPGFEAVVFEGSAFWFSQLTLILGSGADRVAVPLASGTRMGAEMGTTASYQIRDPEWVDAIPGGPLELRLEMDSGTYFHSGYDDGDLWCEEDEDSGGTETLVCARTDAGILCGRIPTSYASHSADTCEGPDEDEDDDDNAATAREAESEEARTTWELDLRLEGGRATLTPREELTSTEPRYDRSAYDRLVGDHDLLELLRHPDHCAAGCPRAGAAP